MFRNLIYILLSLIFTGCAASTSQRNIASSAFNSEIDEQLYLQDFEPYFLASQNHKKIILVNNFSNNLDYKIIALGNVKLLKDKGDCHVSGSGGEFYPWRHGRSCAFHIIRAHNNSNGQDGEVRVYKKGHRGPKLIISEFFNPNKITKNQCQALVKHAYLAQNPDTLHKEQYNIINGKYVFKQQFINDCNTMNSFNIDNHHKTNLFRHCMNNYFEGNKKRFISSEDGQPDHKLYLDHLNELAGFEPDSYCQDIEDE